MIFVIPLMPRANSRDWRRTCFHFKACISSLLRQTNPMWSAYVAYTDLPPGMVEDDRITLLCHTRVLKGSYGPDKGARLGTLYRHLAGHRPGPGWIMPLDADDLVSRNLVARVLREEPEPGRLLLVGTGIVLSPSRWRMKLHNGFYGICGSCNIACLDPSVRRHRGILRRTHRTMKDGLKVKKLSHPFVLYTVGNGSNWLAKGERSYMTTESKVSPQVEREFGLGKMKRFYGAGR